MLRVYVCVRVCACLFRFGVNLQTTKQNTSQVWGVLILISFWVISTLNQKVKHIPPSHLQGARLKANMNLVPLEMQLSKDLNNSLTLQSNLTVHNYEQPSQTGNRGYYMKTNRENASLWELHPWTLTWHWKIPIFNRKYIFKGSIFHCYVSLPDCANHSKFTHTFVVSLILPNLVLWLYSFMDPYLRKYCWWKKSCTSWYGKYPIIYKVLYIPGGCLGFLPSTVVCPDWGNVPFFP